MSSTLVLVNRAAGGGRAGAFWERVEPLARAISAFEVVLPADAAASRAAVGQALVAGCRRIVAVGGDGTVHLVVNELLAADRAGDVTIGVMPAGTGSDLARSLAIPRDSAAALTRALLGPPQPLDAGRCECLGARLFFVNVASAGLSGLVDEKVNAMPRRGRTAYALATLAALVRYRSIPVRVELDGEAWYEGPLFVLAVANGTTFGKGMLVAPDSAPDDGWFDVVLVGRVTALELARHLPKVYFGRHIGAKPVRYRRARLVRLTPLAPLPSFDVDGEVYTSGAASFSVMPGALRIAGAPAG